MERARFVRELASGEWTMSELCEHHGISRPTGYKWAARYDADGDEGLKERSRAPRGCPHRTATEIEEKVVLLKKTHGWGARKLHRLLRKEVSAAELPCRSTVFDILKRHGLVKSRRRRQKWQHPGAVRLQTDAPNEVWTIDFKASSGPATVSTATR
jgi:putative transposase